MTLMWKEILEQPAILQKMEAGNMEVIERILAAVKQKDISLVAFAGRGTSYHASLIARYYLETYVGIPCTQTLPSVVTLYGGQLQLGKALVIGVSQSGKAADVLEVLKRGKSQGAVTVGVTNDQDSPIAHEADFHLFLAADEERSVAATKTFTAQAYVLMLLAAKWSGDNRLYASALTVPELVASTLQISETVRQKTTHFRLMKEAILLGRGYAYPAALEASLKLQETCYVGARAFPIAEFHHGPFAVLERDFPVFVFAGNGQSKQVSLEMLEKLRTVQPHLTVFSAEPELLALGDTSIRLPDAMDEAAAFFTYIAAAQMFACSLSLAHGLNPDAPRNLSKVTITK